MKNVARVVFVVSIAALLSAPALAQRAVTPPPRPADNGPSLAVTMKFIQDKLNALGKLTYAVYIHDNATGQEGINQDTAELTNVIADPATCRISFHWKTTRDDTSNDTNGWVPLHDVEKLEVITGDEQDKRKNAKNGHPTWQTRVDPPIFVLLADRVGGLNNTFVFNDEDTANRIAKAMIHAVELCGGGSKDPF